MTGVLTQTAENTSNKIEKTISAVFKERDQIDVVIKRLLDRGVAREDISVMGKNFHSETRISGFLTKRDIILGGLKQGGIFGSLFGSVLGLLTGVGVLFVPFVGTLVAAGPIGAVLLGAAGGAIAGSAGAGLASAFMVLGMPEDKATLYQTRIEAGEYLVMVEVPADRTGEIQLLLESAGGEELSTLETTLPRQQIGQLTSPEQLSPEIQSHLSGEAQQVFLQQYNQALAAGKNEQQAEHDAWDVICQQYDEDEQGVWSKQKMTV
jgi:cation transport regulator ChaB